MGLVWSDHEALFPHLRRTDDQDVYGAVHEFTASGDYVRGWSTGPSIPDGLAVDLEGNVYVADIGEARVLKYTNNGTYVTMWGSEGSGDGQFLGPVRVAVGPTGTVYVTDNGNSRVQTFTAEGVFISRWGSHGSAPAQFDNPIGIGVDGHGDIFVAATNDSRMQKFGLGATTAQSVTWGSMKARYRGTLGAK